MDNLMYLKKIISYKTDNNEQEINDCLNYISDVLSKNGWETALIKNDENEKNSLVASYNSALHDIQNGLLLAGHIDTVSTSVDKWATEPLNMTQNNSNLYGLGVADTKSFTSAILSNLLEIKKMPLKKPIVFVLTNDEETVMSSILKVCEFFKKHNIKPEYSVIGEPSLMTFSNSNKGFYEFETVINGVPCHSSNPQLGVNAIYIMSKFITFLENMSSKYKPKGTTLNVGLINGGKMCNIVADKCVIRWDVRTFKKADLISIQRETNSFLEQITSEYSNSSYSSGIVFEIPVFEDKKVEITEQLLKKFNTTEKPYDASTEAGFYQALGIDCIIYGCGDIKEAHSINEKIDLNNYNKYCKNILEIVKKVCC